jgi:hypothetical protein
MSDTPRDRYLDETEFTSPFYAVTEKYLYPQAYKGIRLEELMAV